MYFPPTSSSSAAQSNHLSFRLLKSQEVNVHLAGAVIVLSAKEKHHRVWDSLQDLRSCKNYK